MGIAVAGSSLGGLFWSLLIGHMLEVSGTPWGHRYIAICSFPVLVLACALVQERKGLAGHDAHGDIAIKAAPKNMFRTVWRRDFLALSGAMFFIFFGVLMPFGQICKFAIEHGENRKTGNNHLAALYSASVVGRVLAGELADRFGRFNVTILLTLASAILISCWMEMKSSVAMYAFSILFGFLSGGVLPLGSACVAQITTDMGHIGLRIGCMMAICSIGVIVGNPMAGAIFDLLPKRLAWLTFCLVSGGLTFIGGILLLITRIVLVGGQNLVF